MCRRNQSTVGTLITPCQCDLCLLSCPSSESDNQTGTRLPSRNFFTSFRTANILDSEPLAAPRVAGLYAGEVQGNANSAAIRLFNHVYRLERHQTGFGPHVIGLSQECWRTCQLSALSYPMPPLPRGVEERVQRLRKNNSASRTYCWRMIQRTAIDIRHHKHPNSTEVTPIRRVRPIDF